ncbi:branched-chain amino acid ABC transporter permease [Streptomyces sp. JH002]|jgi:branched-chain amino acid transport system permease protein|uniref:Branched-chain amino acid ABC transporter permease n=1 Tax=Streptomyces xiamenensis TaxID=408015 RepID=A0A0F7FQY3_9ACTN|nr:MULTISPECIES: branched-chain amino acid ABC transporter permease [Streptomyces]AKG42317.1 branched-chain amino acid ABC transporter permease [Streptomyces xiamenensis]MCU4744976.1 branched-chain amino acid ABC transporter permease [Streptomyces sp. G-5]QQN80045.1 branched-chain amino acid ABC transporter permease [Streptomyces sp. XC 2026]
MSLQDFWDVLVLGVVLGSLYAVIAIGYTLVYGVLQLLNFAHSEVFMSGGFGGLIILTIVVPAADPSGIQSVGYVLLGIAAGALIGGGVAFGLERVAYRPLRRRGAPRLVFLITAIGASFFIYNLAGKVFGRNAARMPTMYENKTLFTLFGTPINVTQALVVASAVLMLILVDFVVNRTKLGSGIRAVAQDPEVASLMGVNIDRVVSRTFVLGGLMGGVAGFLYGTTTQVWYTMGFLPGITAFAAAVLGGIGNVRGAMLGGLLLGVVEAMTVEIWGDSWRYVGAFAVLVAVLMFRPTGILGERVARTA